MSKNDPQLQEEFADAVENLDIDEGDYAFVISAEGELKHLFTPEGFDLDPPRIVQRILKLLGITDINSVGYDSETLH